MAFRLHRVINPQGQTAFWSRMIPSPGAGQERPCSFHGALPNCTSQSTRQMTVFKFNCSEMASIIFSRFTSNFRCKQAGKSSLSCRLHLQRALLAELPPGAGLCLLPCACSCCRPRSSRAGARCEGILLGLRSPLFLCHCKSTRATPAPQLCDRVTAVGMSPQESEQAHGECGAVRDCEV